MNILLVFASALPLRKEKAPRQNAIGRELAINGSRNEHSPPLLPNLHWQREGEEHFNWFSHHQNVTQERLTENATLRVEILVPWEDNANSEKVLLNTMSNQADYKGDRNERELVPLLTHEIL